MLVLGFLERLLLLLGVKELSLPGDDKIKVWSFVTSPPWMRYRLPEAKSDHGRWRGYRGICQEVTGPTGPI